jgi:DNA-binding CsgD family transcriptional regulator
MVALEAAKRIGDDAAEFRLWTRVVACWASLDDPEEGVGASLRECVAAALLIGPPGSIDEFVAFLDAVPAEHLTGLERGALSIARELTGEAKGELARRYRGHVIDLFDRFDVFDQPRDAFSVTVLTLGSRLPPDDERGPRAMDLAAEIAREIGSPRARLQEITIRSHSRQFSGDPSGAADYIDRELENLGDVPGDEVGFLEGNLIWCRIVEGDHVRAQEVGERALARLRRPQLVTQLWEHLVENHSFSLTCTGDWDRARALLEESAPWWEDDLRSSNMRLCMLDLLQGKDPDVERWRPMVGREIPGGAPQVTLHQLIAAEAAARGDLGSARATWRDIWADPDILVLDDYLWLVLVDAARAEADAAVVDPGRADRDEAEANMHVVMETAGAMRHYGVLSEVWPLDLAAQLDRFHGRDARQALQAALDGWDRIGHVPDVATTHLSLAEAHAVAGDRDEARRHLATGRAIAEQLGAAPMLARAERIAETYALAARERRTTEVLTGREAEVLTLLAEGRTNAEIAATLYMSPKTASVHVSHIIAKLGAANRTEAAATARRQGLLQ